MDSIHIGRKIFCCSEISLCIYWSPGIISSRHVKRESPIKDQLSHRLKNHLDSPSKALSRRIQKKRNNRSRKDSELSNHKEMILKNKLENEIISKQKKLDRYERDILFSEESDCHLKLKIEELDNLIEKWKSTVLDIIDALKSNLDDNGLEKLRGFLKESNINSILDNHEDLYI